MKTLNKHNEEVKKTTFKSINEKSDCIFVGENKIPDFKNVQLILRENDEYLRSWTINRDLMISKFNNYYGSISFCTPNGQRFKFYNTEDKFHAAIKRIFKTYSGTFTVKSH